MCSDEDNCLNIRDMYNVGTFPLVSLSSEYGWHMDIFGAYLLSLVRGCPMA